MTSAPSSERPQLDESKAETQPEPPRGNAGMAERARAYADDPRIAEREHVVTPLGEVCMSHTEAQAYREAREEQELLRGEASGGLDER